MGLFTKVLSKPQCKFKIKKRQEYDKKGILEKEYYTVSELYYLDKVSRFDNTSIKHRGEKWKTMSEYEWSGFKSELGPRRYFAGYTEFSLEQAQNYIKARQEDAPVNRVVETEISESALIAE
jgi:hypothetical protein